jgi:glycosyltransferase involved in cell wall biosynthesis
VVQTFSHVTFAPIQIALHKQGSDHLLFTGNHMTASVFPLAQSKSKWWHRASLINLFMRKLPGVYVSRHIVKCFGATSDCSRVATEFLGVPREKIVTIPLGVDTDIFHPSESDKDKESERVDLGYSPDDIVCIYTGRFTKDKNPLLLAQAVDALADVDNRFKGLFFGAGEQREAIGKCRNVKIMGFVPFHNLAKYYRLADIGVWPTQESTSMIDAAACGLPIVVNDTLRATERIEGNGVTYRLNDKEDLVRALASLADSSLRRRLGQAGATKMLDKFSWQSIARVRLEEYKAALQAQHKPD